MQDDYSARCAKYGVRRGLRLRSATTRQASDQNAAARRGVVEEGARAGGSALSLSVAVTQSAAGAPFRVRNATEAL